VHKIDRHREILKLLQLKEVVTVDEICEHIDSSRATTRRDLSALESLNKLIRVHGGATRLPKTLGSGNFEHNLKRNQQSKIAIARTAAALCNTGDSIIINGGTTTWHMCDFINLQKLQVLTNSLPIATSLQNGGSCQVFVTGGEVYADQHIVLGDYATALPFYADKMFMGAHAIARHGLMESDSRLIQAEKALIEQAQELIVLADSSKFSNKGLLQLCPLNRISKIVTDTNVSDQILDMLAQAGIEVIRAEAEALNT